VVVVGVLVVVVGVVGVVVVVVGVVGVLVVVVSVVGVVVVVTGVVGVVVISLRAGRETPFPSLVVEGNYSRPIEILSISISKF
jgi:hypothetical protein